jgi:colanic acid/amylovoran biosynthesis glycosyltransferase
LSPEMIKISNRLFQAPGLGFAACDISLESEILNPTYDSILMLDVYEHIPVKGRQRLHQTLFKLLDTKGTIILTLPSVSHQDFLEKFNRAGLQPVDEKVGFDDINKLARDTGCEVVDCHHVTIWHHNDYVHAALKRGSGNIQIDKEIFHIRKGPFSHALESKRSRAKRVGSRLQVEVTPEGLTLQKKKGSPVVCIIFPREEGYSETFIRAHVQRLPARVKVWNLIPQHRADERALISAILRLRPATEIGRIFIDYYKRTAFKIFLMRNKIDAFLVEYGSSGAGFIELFDKTGIPLIVHFHGSDAYNQSILKEHELAYQQMFKLAHAVIAVSHSMEQQLLDLGVPRQKLFYNPYGVDVSLFSGAHPETSPPIFVAVGRFVDKKAPHLTLLAFKKVVEECPQSCLIMIGDGPLFEACKQLAKAFGVVNAVEFRGPRPHIEVAATMRTARAFVQHSMRTSYGDSEGTPVAVLEAGAMGLPVVATRHAGIQDAVIDGETGLLVEEGDWEAMANNMIRLAEDAEFAAHLGRRARERIRTEYSMEKSIEQLWEIIKAAIDEKQSGS